MTRQMSMRTGSQMSASEWAMLLALAVLWGGSFFFFKVMVEAMPPFTVVLCRVGFAALILNAWLWLRGDCLPAGLRFWTTMLGMSLLNNVIPFTLIVFGETRISSGLASILNAATPMFTVLTAQWFTSNEKLTANKLAGVLIGFAGVAILIGPGAMAGLGGSDLAGEAACLLAALSYAFAGVYGRRFKGVDPLKVATGQLTGSTLVLLPVAALVDRPWTLAMPGPGVWGAIAASALFCTVIAYVLYFRILQSAGATNLLLVTFLLPVTALLLGRLVLGETLEPHAFAGMAVIGAGLAAIDGRLWRRVSGTLRAGLPKPPPIRRRENEVFHDHGAGI